MDSATGAKADDSEHDPAVAAATPRGGRQVIPRPAVSRPGGPAPWSVLAPELRAGISLARVRAAIAHPRREPAPVRTLLPEEAAEVSSAPLGTPSAVLAALFEEHGESRVVLTRRAAHLRTHTGEVSFPGGRMDPGETPEAAALREAREEVGLEAQVEVVGRLSPLSTFSSRTTITPVVGLLEHRPDLVANPEEVEIVFDVSLAELAGDGRFREELWVVGANSQFAMWFFELDEDTIWGATARMLVELLRLVLGA